MKSGFVKNIRSRNLEGRGGKGDLEKSKFDWVFLNVGLPYSLVKRAKFWHHSLPLSSPDVRIMLCSDWMSFLAQPIEGMGNYWRHDNDGQTYLQEEI